MTYPALLSQILSESSPSFCKAPIYSFLLKMLRMQYINSISDLFFSLLTKSCPYPPRPLEISIVGALAIVPHKVRVDDISTVLASKISSVVWFARTPVGEDDTFSS